ncbi:MAG: carboxypeptidase regulatory-like domain-containing protein [Candidatus Cloacimonetes bacterium]|nr:carboxypeptidase regulatory-like domain-containing protein [Candidatus Cloacimonadota bacterium]
MSTRRALFITLFVLMASLVMALEVGEMFSFDMGSANPAGVTSDGSKVAAYLYPWSGVMYWTEADGVVWVDDNAEAGAIADNGTIFGSKQDPALGYELPCYWLADNSHHPLPTLDYGINSDQFFASVFSCNAAGTVVGGMQWISPGNTTPVMWYLNENDEWVIVDLMPDNMEYSGRVDAVNSDGSKLGGWVDSATGSWIPSIWTIDEDYNVTYETAPAPPEWVTGSVTAFSQNDEYMAGYMNSMGALWFEDGTYEMFQPEVPSAWMNTTINSVSNGGLCTGRTIDYWNWGQWACVYKPGMGYMRADDYLDMFGVVYPADYQDLDFVFWVSGDESMMFGWYYDTNWTVKMFMLILPDISYIEGTVTLNGTIGSVDEVQISIGSTGTMPDETGYYSLPIGAGTYDVIASMPGYVTAIVEDVVVPEGETVSGIDLTLNQIENAGFLEGNLSAIYSWDPFTMATITAANGNEVYETSGLNDATYQLILPAGIYDIQATMVSCFDLYFEDVEVFANEVTQLDIEFMSIYTPAYIHLDFVVDDPDTFDWSKLIVKLGNNEAEQTINVWESSYAGDVWSIGTYTVSMYCPGYEVWIQEDVEFVMNETVYLEIPLVPNTYPVRNLNVEESEALAGWDAPLPPNAFYQDFENMQTGLNITANLPYWYTPLYPSCNAFATDELAYEGEKALKIDTIDGIPGDIYKEAGWPYPETGVFVFESMLYIPSGKCAHHGITRNSIWGAAFAVEIFYKADATIDIYAAGEIHNFTYVQDEWFSVKLVADLDNDMIQYYHNGELLVSSQYSLDAWTGAVSDLTFGAYDISAESHPDLMDEGLVYMDNYTAYSPAENTEVTYTASLDGSILETGITDLSYNLNDGTLINGQTYLAGITAQYAAGLSEIIETEFTFTGISHLYGDVDDSGFIGAFDAALVLQYTVGLDPAPAAPLPWETWRIVCADVDGNESVEAFDAALILQYVVGMIEIFPVEEPGRFTPAVADIQINADEEFITFSTTGNLYAFQLTVDNADGFLNMPQFTSTDALTAINLEDYKAAIASATQLTGAFLKIPYNFAANDIPTEITISYKANCISSESSVDLTFLAGGPDDLPAVSELLSNVPNPFNPETAINFSIKTGETGKLSIYNTRGQLVTSKTYEAGNHSYIWNAGNKASGMYFCSLKTPSCDQKLKMILLK